MDCLADIRYRLTNLQAIISNEIFSVKTQTANQETTITKVFDDLIIALEEEKEALVQRIKKQNNFLLNDFDTLTSKVIEK